METIAVFVLIYILGVFSGVGLTFYIGYRVTSKQQQQEELSETDITALAAVVAEHLLDEQRKHLNN